MKTVSKNEIEVLNQEIDERNGLYRIRAGSRVHYVTIPTGTFDDDTMCRPHLLIPQLPDFPDYDWTKMQVSRDNGNIGLRSTLSSEPLAEIQEIWHPRRIDVLSLVRTKRLQSGVHEVLCEGRPAISKIARFEWEVPRIDRETWAHRILVENRLPDEAPFAPKFLAHLTENGRVIGFLMEKAEGTPAGLNDLKSCQALVRRLHYLGLVHGDVNRYNFVVDRRPNGLTLLVDFEHAEGYNEEAAQKELESLPSELTEETGRGRPVIVDY
ncbi:hypothetical protein ACRE_011500 [Hapsidospora chrysogenum ATCC 11550]|uniref:Uncharacterized protein n=1 Tax=Hapsidospora chrysogenum (strain ATCC 11550 / CBS 779.69 / DSM 880 / IAM 14645 / JCM 23072 / IMI 49137) TaxID=857340 RepID=A0A086TEX9_HAPC1|nr:hypothetical protein ACRE_011500 [Hapsidospora chrysogenum ATCC 11550]